MDARSDRCRHSSRRPARQPQGGGRGGGGRGGAAGLALFNATDTNKDGAVTRDEFKTTLDGWYSTWDSAKTGGLAQAQLAAGVSAAMPAPPRSAAPATCGGRSSNPRVACQPDVEAMMAALPEKAPAKPLKPRKILVLGRAAGFVHSSIPLAGRTVEAMGAKTGAWTTTISWDAADINTANLQQYDAILLNSTTGCFLDDPNDKAATDARRAALLAFVRGGKGIAAIHADDRLVSRDSVRRSAAPAAAPGGGGRATGPGAPLAAAISPRATPTAISASAVRR